MRDFFEEKFMCTIRKEGSSSCIEMEISNKLVYFIAFVLLAVVAWAAWSFTNRSSKTDNKEDPVREIAPDDKDTSPLTKSIDESSTDDPSLRVNDNPVFEED